MRLDDIATALDLIRSRLAALLAEHRRRSAGGPSPATAPLKNDQAECPGCGRLFHLILERGIAVFPEHALIGHTIRRGRCAGSGCRDGILLIDPSITTGSQEGDVPL